MKTSVNNKSQAHTFKLIALATLLTLCTKTAQADFQKTSCSSRVKELW